MKKIKITNPPNRFLAVSCAARVTITPPNPNPATSPVRLISNIANTKNIAII